MTSASELRRKPRAVGVLLAIGALIAQPATLHANEADALTRTAARELALEGATLFDQQDYGQALERFRRAFSVFPAPSIAIMEARTLVRLGRLVEALDKYEETRRLPLTPQSPEAFQKAAADAASELDELRPRVPRLVIEVTGAANTRDATLTIDGKPVARALWGVALPVDPGPHKLRLSQPSAALTERAVTLAEGARARVQLDLRPASPSAAETSESDASPSSSTLLFGWTGVGLGAAALTTSAITGALALSAKSDLDSRCRPGCPPSARDDIDAFRRDRTLSYVSLGVGAVALAAGGYLLLSGGDDAPRVGALLTPASAALVGAF